MIIRLFLPGLLLAFAGSGAMAQTEVIQTAPARAQPPASAAAPALAGGPAAAKSGKPARPPTLVTALIAAGLDPHTKLIGDSVQVMYGQRATLHIDAGKPVLDAVEIGRIDMALPDGTPDTYKALPAGRLAFAVDSSPQKKQSFLKIWNGLPTPIGYEVEITALRGPQLAKRKVQVCAVPGGGTTYEVWSDPVIAVTLSKISEAADDKITCK